MARQRKRSGVIVHCAECDGLFQLWHRSDKAIYCRPKCNYAAKKRAGNERAKCLACHALVGMTCTASGKMVNLGHAVISLERKDRGIIGIGYEQAARIAHMKIRAALGVDLKAKVDQWFKNEWGGVVESYWENITTPHVNKMVLNGRGINTQKMSDGMAGYYLDHTRSKQKSTALAMIRYQKVKNNPEEIVRRNIRNQIKRVCRKSNSTKQGRTLEHLGCSIASAKRHLEKLFKNGMTWGNYGDLWEVDHIIPMSKFDLRDGFQRMRVNHYTNLQPMLKVENRSKGAKITRSHQLALL